MKLKLIKLYKILQNEFKELNWWPVDLKYHKKRQTDPRFEIIVGAILTQNTAWSNVEKALTNLKLDNIIDLEGIIKTDVKKLEEIIRPSGFFKQKAQRLKVVADHFRVNYDNNLDNFFNKNFNHIREELLSINGIGPETADSILLYAGKKPIFVVDAYTKRISKRIPLNAGNSYDEIQNYFQKNLSNNFSKEELPKVYGELHAAIVMLAKNYCKKKPDCSNCPLKKQCNFNKILS
jgi:endonuclease-3 related protein